MDFYTIWYALSQMAPDEIPQILGKKDRTAAGPTAPAHGLTMMGIEYGE